MNNIILLNDLHHAVFEDAFYEQSQMHGDDVTHSIVEASDYILMPYHLISHWVLLVSCLKLKYWVFYDLIPNVMHRASLLELIFYIHLSLIVVLFT